VASVLVAFSGVSEANTRPGATSLTPHMVGKLASEVNSRRWFPCLFRRTRGAPLLGSVLAHPRPFCKLPSPTTSTDQFVRFPLSPYWSAAACRRFSSPKLASAANHKIASTFPSRSPAAQRIPRALALRSPLNKDATRCCRDFSTHVEFITVRGNCVFAHRKDLSPGRSAVFCGPERCQRLRSLDD
jgi:hypothetical protein